MNDQDDYGENPSERITDEHRELISRLQGVELRKDPCTTCAPDTDGLNVVHAEDCPISIEIEAAVSRDREWFDAHPAADFFYRKISWGEAAQLVTMSTISEKLPTGAALTPQGRVRVERALDGVRFRRFDDVYFVAES